MNNEIIISSVIAERKIPPIKWFLIFPKSKSQKYYRTGTDEQHLIHAYSAQQALGYWLTQDDERNIFANYKDVVYENRHYKPTEGRILYRKLEKTDDWEAVKM